MLLCTVIALVLPSVEAQGELPIAIHNVTVIDASSEDPRAGMTVLVDGDTISRVDREPPPPGANVIDGSGKFLIPGLWDMHVHMTWTPGFAKLYIANGVIGVRDMFTFAMMVRALRKGIRDGTRVGPRIIPAGRIVDGEKPFWPSSYEAKNAEEGRAAVTAMRKEGAEFIKVYSKLSREAYFAIADEAKQQGIPFAGHVPYALTVAEASEAGQKSIEHLTGVLEACSKGTPQSGLSYAERSLFYIKHHDAEQAAALYEKLVANETWMCPTLTVSRGISHMNDPEFCADERLRYVPKSWEERWKPENDFRFKERTAADWTASRAAHEKHMEIVGAMHRAGVRILAGTDAANPYCFPGFGLHDELALLVDSGLSPRAALLAATSGPAEFLGIENEIGTVEAGKAANLLLLDSNPLDDIRNTTKIRAVVAEGRLFDRDQLDALLAEVAR